jgi:hypothetical protein
MKNVLSLFIFMVCFSCAAFPQGGIWTWISGDSIQNAPGSYGTQGVPSVGNRPPALYEYTEWKDNQGYFWIYGGYFPSPYSDLWKYNPVTNEWTWVKGPGMPNLPPVYGTQGIPDPANTPGQRSWASASWVDTSGNLWLYGGHISSATDVLNDLWKYDITTNEWTWISGTSGYNLPAVHGIQGVPNALNSPGSRCETASAWTDGQNNLWLFGGLGYDENGLLGRLNDMMKYDIAANEWTWMKGSATASDPGSFGTRGVSDPSNVPAARMAYAKWKDLQDNFWIFGGTSIPTIRNDLWKYNPGINEWVWMTGPTISNDAGSYGNLCSFDSSNSPASRTEHRASVTDQCGRFWLFGGFPALNDLWIFDPAVNQWSLLSPNQPYNYGALGVPSASNAPRLRNGAVAFWSSGKKMYVFAGGDAGDSYNDLWVFDPDTNCISMPDCIVNPTSGFNAQNMICPGTCTDFTNLSMNATSYQWIFPGAMPDSSTSMNPINICYPSPGSYDVELIAFNANGSDTLLIANYVTVYPSQSQSVTQSGDTLSSIAGAASYQWYFNGNIISGATDYLFVASMSGDYNLIATDSNGCEVEAAIYNVIADLPSTVDRRLLTVFPNPVGETLNVISYSLIGTAVEISVYNVLGETMMAVYLPIANCALPTCILDVSNLQSGIYFLEISSPQNSLRAKFVKQ